MSTKKVRNSFDVTGDVEVAAMIKRYKELRGYQDSAKAEQDQVSEKIKNKMREHGADELVDNYVAVARLDTYEKNSFDTESFRKAHPRIWRRFVTLGKLVERISVP